MMRGNVLFRIIARRVCHPQNLSKLEYLNRALLTRACNCTYMDGNAQRIGSGQARAHSVFI